MRKLNENRCGAVGARFTLNKAEYGTKDESFTWRVPGRGADAVESGVDGDDDASAHLEPDFGVKPFLEGTDPLSATSSMAGDAESNARRTASSSDCTRP